jgi:hypothetical protein
MIEMRWYVPVEGDKVLQYRQQYDATIRTSSPNMITWPQGPAPNMQWSEWCNVPVIAERDPSYP